MDPNHSYYPTSSNPSSPGAPFVSQSAYQHPVGYLEPFPNYTEYNNSWSPDQLARFLHIASQMTGGEQPASEHVATTNNGFQCRWDTAGVPCGLGFADFDDLIIHLRLHDVQGTASRRLECQWLTDNNFCGKELRRDGFKRHIASHIGLSATCTECGKSFSREDTLREHRKKAHEN